MDSFSKTVQYSGEAIVDDIKVQYNFSIKDGQSSPIQFSFSVGKAAVSGNINPSNDYLYYNVSGGILENPVILENIISKGKLLPMELNNAQ